MVSEAIANGDVAAINYFVADKYMKVLAELADSPNQKVLIMPIEATSVLGSLAGIAEIAKATFGDGAGRDRPAASRRRACRGRPTGPATTLTKEHAMNDIIAHIAALGPWAWIIAGAILLALELAVPGAFMMWLGLAGRAGRRASRSLVAWSWQAQGIAFAVFALLSVPLWRRFARKVEPQSESPLLNRRTEALIGRVFTLDKPIVDGVGTVRIDDTIWRVTAGRTRPAGSRIKVTRADGANLMVEPAT